MLAVRRFLGTNQVLGNVCGALLPQCSDKLFNVRDLVQAFIFWNRFSFNPCDDGRVSLLTFGTCLPISLWLSVAKILVQIIFLILFLFVHSSPPTP